MMIIPRTRLDMMTDFPAISRGGATLSHEDQDLLLETLQGLDAPFAQAALTSLIRANCRCTGIAADGLATAFLQRLTARGMVDGNSENFRITAD